MLGYMNSEALIKTIETGEAHYWSRSRKILWHKGANSGLVQRVIEMRIDDDQDAIWLRVSVAGNGASCHVGYKSCFYRQILVGSKADISEMSSSNVFVSNTLVFTEQTKTFDPLAVYGEVPNPTQL
jgi:phosphoribosyl-AMP cyclohydrolase